MSEEKLDGMLQVELRRDSADGQTVRMILQILKERESAREAEITPEADEALDMYKLHTRQKSARAGRILKTASAAAILLVLFATIPQQVEAESFFGRLASWTDSVFRLFDPAENEVPTEYIYETDNPGLQQVYDPLVGLGATEPVAPRWLPEGYELIECKVQDASRKTKTTATFANGENYILCKVVNGPDTLFL